MNWRWNYNIGGGQLLDWIGHHCDIAHWGLDFDNAGPSEIEGKGEFPAPDALLGRWLTALGLDDDQARNALCFPYEVRRDQPLRYYQELATNRGVAAVLQVRHGRRPPRVLITQATGTG